MSKNKNKNNRTPARRVHRSGSNRPARPRTDKGQRLGQVGARAEIGFGALRRRFTEPEMIYAPFSWLIATAKVTRNQAANLNALVEEAIRQRANPGYLFCLPNTQLAQGQPVEGPEIFLSDEYLEVFGEALKTAKAAGLSFSYCDEWTWPSGQAFGNLLLRHPELRAQTLHYEITEVPGGGTVRIGESFFAVAAKCAEAADGATARILSKTLRVVSRGEARDWQAPGDGCWRVYRFMLKPNDMGDKDGWSNVNYLDRRLPERFIELAQRPYEERFGDEFGKTIPGFFMDHEGLYGWKLAWSADLEEAYRRKKKRDIRLWMPLMIHRDVEGVWAKARWDWHDVVSELYADNFFKATSRWAAARGMYHTVHFYEEGLGIQAVLMGSMFRLLRAVSLPGVDCLADAGLWVRHFKETQSVAEFEGRRMMAEAFGCYGWNLAPLEMKKIGNCLTAWSVSHVIQASMTPDRDLRKYLYGPELSFMPYARYLSQWNDFMRRTSFINSHGHTVPDVLVLSPLDSVWAAAGGDRFDATDRHYAHGKEGELLCYWSFPRPVTGVGIRKLDGGDYVDHVEKAYTGLMEDLTDRAVEFLVADAEYFQSMNVRPNGTLVRGEFTFRAVILPPSLILPEATAEKLLAFAEQGGEVYIMGEAPVGSAEEGIGYLQTDPLGEDRVSTPLRAMADRMRCPPPGSIAGIPTRMQQLMVKLLALPSVRQAPDSIRPYCKAGSGLASKLEFLEGQFPLLLQHRVIDGRAFYWLANNTGREQAVKVCFRGASGAAAIWDCETGKATPVPSVATPAGSILRLSFGPCEGYWLVFEPIGTPLAETHPAETEAEIVDIAGPWTMTIDPADQPPPPLPGGTPVFPAAFLRENGGLRDTLKLWSEWGLTEFNGLVMCENTFVLPSGVRSASLSLGRLSHAAEVWLNDRKVGAKLWPPYEFDVTGFLKKGENRIKVVVANLLCTPKPTPGGGFILWKEKAEDFDAGLLGPVRLAFRP